MSFRPSIVALLSWLGLPLCGQTETSILEVLQRLDLAFNQGDVADYLGVFDPDHPGSHALLGQRLHRVLPLDTGTISFERRSTIVGTPRTVGPRTVVRVRHEIFAGDHRVAADLEDSIMAFRTDGDKVAVPTFVTETPRQIDCPAGDVFRCPPCNYEIGGSPGWLCVPMGRDRAQALEASSFYFLGSDLACDVSVRIDSRGRTAIRLVEELAAALHQVEPAAEVQQVATPWLPLSTDAKKFPELSGARIEVAIPGSSSDDGSVALFHVVQFGSLQHLLLLRGSKQAVEKHRPSLDKLLASFMLLDTDAERALAGAKALKFHVGGTIEEGSKYRNEKYDVSFDGPEGWKAQQLCGGAAFHVVWSAPSSAMVHLFGYTVPPGMSYWCEETAAHWVRQLCKKGGRTLPKNLVDWKADGNCEATAITLTCVAKDDSERLLRVAFREDLLIVIDASGASDEDWQAVRKAIATLRL